MLLRPPAVNRTLCPRAISLENPPVFRRRSVLGEASLVRVEVQVEGVGYVPEHLGAIHDIRMSERANDRSRRSRIYRLEAAEGQNAAICFAHAAIIVHDL